VICLAASFLAGAVLSRNPLDCSGCLIVKYFSLLKDSITSYILINPSSAVYVRVPVKVSENKLLTDYRLDPDVLYE
jgi:hypothetical protein